jgi:sulfoxide reductase heme-binding subunit YedZ
VTAVVDPTQHIWWLASRSFGIVAIVLVSLSVGLGLALAGRLLRGPGMAGRVKRAHEALALSGLVAIALHGLLLLGDPYLHPSLAGIAIPFMLPGQPVWTAVGIVAGWLTAIVTLSFYARRLIGVAAWRKLHRLTFVVYALGIAHTLGSGTDAGATWLLAILAITATPIAVAGANRLLRPPRSRARATRPQPASAPPEIAASP